jgi:hypothetical protein
MSDSFTSDVGFLSSASTNPCAPHLDSEMWVLPVPQPPNILVRRTEPNCSLIDEVTETPFQVGGCLRGNLCQMKTAIASTALLTLVLTSGCKAQNSGTSLADSHIEGNVPASQNFDTYMKRDLASFLCEGAQNCRVEYGLLREGPTQTGIAYPKFYVWVVRFQQDKVLTQGAARVAAIDKQPFHVTDFLSREQILESPQQVGSIFPAPLVSKILQRAH